MAKVNLPADPLKNIGSDYSVHRRTIQGVLASYNNNYDILSEIIQNSVDAVEDQLYTGTTETQTITIIIDLKDNKLSVLDTGVGMTPEECISAFAPHVSFKDDERRRRYKTKYRGFKGVGLTFISYGTNSVSIHSKTLQSVFSGKMKLASDWVNGITPHQPEIVEDDLDSQLDKLQHGTLISVQLSQSTRPKRLSRLANDIKAWEVILRTRTAIGQIGLSNDISRFSVKLRVIDQNGAVEQTDVTTEFLYPHLVKRPTGQATFRFKNLTEHYRLNPEQPPRAEDKRQDGIYFYWGPERILTEFSKEEKEQYETSIVDNNVHLYCFLPYSRALFKELDQISSGRSDRSYMKPGLVIGVNGQRLAEYFDFKPTRYESLSQNLFLVASLDNAEPDQGRKTLKDEDMESVQRAANRALQWIAGQRDFLRPSSDRSSPEHIENERNHDDWKHNVIDHYKNNKLFISDLPSKSIPLTEQDVVAIFSQICALGYLSGIEILSTSSSHTYDGLIRFSTKKSDERLVFNTDNNLLGISQYIIGDPNSRRNFETKYLTIEFKTSLEGLISEVENPDNPKDLRSIDILICWSRSSDNHRGYEILEIEPSNIDERKYPGVTHILTRLEDETTIFVIQLENLIEKIAQSK